MNLGVLIIHSVPFCAASLALVGQNAICDLDEMKNRRQQTTVRVNTTRVSSFFQKKLDRGKLREIQAKLRVGCCLLPSAAFFLRKSSQPASLNRKRRVSVRRRVPLSLRETHSVTARMQQQQQQRNYRTTSLQSVLPCLWPCHPDHSSSTQAQLLALDSIRSIPSSSPPPPTTFLLLLLARSYITVPCHARNLDFRISSASLSHPFYANALHFYARVVPQSQIVY